MILNEVNFYSEMLTIRSTMYILLPQRTLAEAKTKNKPNYRTLYLLHGYTDDHTAWMRWSNIEKYVEGLNLAVVMPAVNLSFYTDMAQGRNYFQFISDEVPAIVRNMFSLSDKREDNFVAGLSMGGYGAFKLALTHPERYAAAASLSGAMDIVTEVRNRQKMQDEAGTVEFRTLFGDLDALEGSKHDLFALAEKVSKGSTKPRLYQACGTGDFLYEANVRFREHVRKLPLEVAYEEGPGEHVWAYWDTMIQRVLRWMFE